MRNKKNKCISMMFIIILIVSIFSQINLAAESSDINGINEQKYPGYKTLISELKAKYPNWNFVLNYTGLDWNSVIVGEYQGHGDSPKSLSPANDSRYAGEWICGICGTKTYDSENWYCASEKAIAYMMDPRNSLNATDVFQFQDLSSNQATRNGIAAMVSGTFLNHSDVIDAIMEASTKYNVNGYYLVARIIQEQTKNGSTLSLGNGYQGQYVGVYNFFNIGASGNGEEKVILNGLKYASDKGWTTKQKAIVEGAELIAKNYIAVGQKTLYYQKFNVVNQPYYDHQYMQNILAAQNEGTTLRKTYIEIDSDLSENYTFVIPVYENMPQVACPRPSVTGTSSTTYEKAIINANGGLAVRNGASASAERISGVAEGVIVTILERATQKVDGYYWDKIMTPDGVTGYVAREAKDGSKTYLVVIGGGDTSSNDQTNSGEKIKLKDNLISCLPNVSVVDLKEKYTVQKIEKSDGTQITDNTAQLATGDKVTIEEKQYTVAKKGDLNSDTNMDILDVVTLINQLKVDETISPEKIEAGKIISSDIPSILDVVAMLNVIKGEQNIQL